MLNMSLDNMLDSTLECTELVIEYHNRKNETTYFNADTVPKKLLDFPVSYIELLQQYDGTTALCFTVYE